MTTRTNTIGKAAMALGALGMVTYSAPALAALANETVTVNVGVHYVSPIGLSVSQHMDFGLIDNTMATAETVVIGTDDVVTDANNNVLGEGAVSGAPNRAIVSLSTTSAEPVTLLVDSIGTNTYYTLGTFICSYNNGADTACDSDMSFTTAGSGAALVDIGATLTYKADASAVTGAEDTTFDVTVTYD